MKVTLPDQTVATVRWRYEGEIAQTPVVTECYITREPDGLLLAFAPAICHTNDHFNKNKGRKISLERAIRPYPVEVRKMFWDAYFVMRGNKW